MKRRVVRVERDAVGVVPQGPPEVDDVAIGVADDLPSVWLRGQQDCEATGERFGVDRHVSQLPPDRQSDPRFAAVVREWRAQLSHAHGLVTPPASR